MKTRITSKVVSFAHDFFLDEFDEALPAGSYSVETEEERLDGLTFYAYRRVGMTLVVPAQPGRRGRDQYVRIDPLRLGAALELDQRRSDAAKLDSSGAHTSASEDREPTL